MPSFPRRGLFAMTLALLPAWLLAPNTWAVSLLARGSQGPSVSVLQQELQDLGYHPGGITGTFSLTTESAVKAYQRNHQLVVDGIVGPLTDQSLAHSLRTAFIPVTGPLGIQTLTFLDAGHSVVTLQQDLGRLGYYAGAADGVFNDATVAAVRAFQAHQGLKVTGLATPATIQAIQAALNPKPPASSPSLPAHAGTPSSSTVPAASAAPASPMVLGYYVPSRAAQQDLIAHASQITAIAPFWYSIRPDGSLHNLGQNESALTTWCHDHQIGVYPMVINGYGNDTMLTNSAIMQQDVQTLINLTTTQGYDGLNIDFESLNNADESGLNAFVTDLAAGLHQAGKKLIVSVGPRTSDANGYHVYDYRTLGAAADYVDLMTYDDHDNTGSPGPVAPMNWVSAIVQYAEATIPSSKILVGLAGYGYDWSSAGNAEISDTQALALVNQYGYRWVGGTTEEPTITYTADGVTHTVWFEDSYSEAFKVALVSQNHLGGVALWDLGEEDSGVWPMLQNSLH
ncbi:MAG: peptidoglycan-binding protein [Sulfobacillus sp.]|nr:peptidoglycan-binding protein [Sulfobacillus sp.]